MGKALLQINKFDGGLVNYYDPRDLPENALSDSTGLMCDIQGKVRPMGRSTTHAIIGEALSGNFYPGYGLFAFNADNKISGSFIETKMLAVQNGNFLTIYDGELHTNAVELTPPASGFIDTCKPVFMYVDGNLRISNKNVSTNMFHPKSYTYIDTNWFYGITNFKGGDGFQVERKWHTLDNYVFPPTHAITGVGQLICRNSYGSNTTSTSSTEGAFGVLSKGTVQLSVTATSTGGEWIGDTALQFGASFIYKDGQESPITAFLGSDGENEAIDTTSVADNHKIGLKIAIGFPSDETAPYEWDPRIAGVVIYLIGDSLSQFDDPQHMATCHFGDGANQVAYFESHAGDKKTDFVACDTPAGSNTGVQSNTYLYVKKIPAVTYELRTGVESNEDTTSARFTTAVIVNRRAYIGGVRRVSFERDKLVSNTILNSAGQPINTTGNCQKQCVVKEFEPEYDRMMISPVNNFDVFPSDPAAMIDVAINDGEKITCLISYADRILQFKNKNLYIINISQDMEYLESEHKYMGVEHHYQVCTTEFGIAWVNRNGCFLYDGEKITNLILGKINPTEVSTFTSPGWSTFLGQNGMIGWLQELKQIVIFEDPSSEDEFIVNENAQSDLGEVMIYDMQTGAWSRGEGKVNAYPKSNIVSNYDDTCMFLTQMMDSSNTVHGQQTQAPVVGSECKWEFINATQDSQMTNSQLVLNDGESDEQLITDIMNYQGYDIEGISFDTYLKQEIEAYNNGTTQNLLVNENESTAFDIVRPVHLITTDASGAINDDYANKTLTWTNSATQVNWTVTAEKWKKVGGIQFWREAGEPWVIESLLYLSETNNSDPRYNSFTRNDEEALGGVDVTTFMINISSTDEYLGSLNGYTIFEQYPYQVLAYHALLDAPENDYYLNNENTTMMGNHDIMMQFIGSPNQNPGGVGRWQNPDKSQIYIYANAAGNAAFTSVDGDSPLGSATKFVVDMSLHHLNFWEDLMNSDASPWTASNECLHGDGHKALGNSPCFGYKLENGQDYDSMAGYTADDRLDLYRGQRLYVDLFDQAWTSFEPIYVGPGGGEGNPVIVQRDASMGMTIRIPMGQSTVINTVNVDGINGSGTDLISAFPSANDTIQYGTAARSRKWVFDGPCWWEAPSVTYRTNATTMYLSLLGDQSIRFESGSTISISGSTKTEHNQTWIINGVQVYNPGIRYPSFGGSDEFNENSNLPSDYLVDANDDIYRGQPFANYDHTSNLGNNYGVITILTFNKSQQSTTVQNLWDTLSSYGDHADITFTQAGTSASIANSGVPTLLGVPQTPSKWNMFFRRRGSVEPGIMFITVIKCNNGDTIYSDIFETATGDNDWSLAGHFADKLEEIRLEDTTRFSSVARATIGPSTVNITNSGARLKITGDYSNKSLLKPGQLIRFTAGGLANGYFYRIKTVGSYSNPYTTIDLCTSVNDPYGGIDATNNVLGAILASNLTTASGDYANATVSTSVIEVEGLAPSSSVQSIALSGWSLGELEVRQFDNGYYVDAEDKVSFTTRDIDFAAPSSTKAFYKINITYKSKTPTNLKIALNGSGDFTALPGGGTLGESTSWNNVEFYLNTDRTPVKATSLQINIGMDNEFVQGLEINDITIIYRAI